jgi:hypothetical protein
MASEPKENSEQHEVRQEDMANADATQREAYEYWGYMLKSDKCGTPMLDRLLKGIAQVIVSGDSSRRRRDLGGVGADGPCRARHTNPAIPPTSLPRRSPRGTATWAVTTTSSSGIHHPPQSHSSTARWAPSTACNLRLAMTATRVPPYLR